ncbi:host cell division inhibitor Icd-like protein [Escherichia coli]|uniref:host cell division inhibitor Icd-like protein n=1 Tax=Escherichia coli TaxID=562 RepID=UPI0017B4D7E0|nr:host cell division inhibitor Icd-like protein [Escherichia coli]EFL7009684.1 host cell division inhibitor Icd-like protein [Escherichia coli]EFO2713901.1 host cell division inhibitor Icd-like protein [Escherichia coli]EHY7639631.1 host cell division inhibitor Icd-like protein [Escherichia coli]EJN7603991.1 host cell division inhibitor Icd-like protein [Escherichia coli]
MCNALTVTKRKSAPLPERLCERITYSTAMFAIWVNFSDKFVQCEGADHRYYSTPEMQNILLQNVVGHVVRKAKNFADGATDTILSGRQVLINLMSDFVLDKTKATVESRQWKSYILERITNNATFAAGGQSVRFTPMTLGLTEGHYGECAGLLVGYSCSLALRRWRRLISPSNAAVTNCPVLSPSSLTLSMASTIWSGTRASILFDFAFTDFVAISDFRLVWCPTMIARKKFNAMLDVSHTDKITCVRHLIFISHKMTKPRTVGAVTGLLTTNDNESIEVAMRNYTTHPQGRDSHNLNKYIWRFIALSTAQPRVITIEATSEQEARQQSPAGCVMVFAARIRQEVHHA